MANVANTKHTGPASKDAVSGRTKLPLKEKVGSIGGMPALNNSSEEAQRTIMGMRFQSTDYASRDAQGTLMSKRSVGVPTGGSFTPTN